MKTWFIGAAGVLLPSLCGAVSLVSNGDFETPVVTGFQNGQGETVIDWYFAPQTFGNWTVESGSVDLIRAPRWQASSGTQCIDLSGQGAGVIYQDLATTSGHTYTLSFAFAGNPEHSEPDMVKHLAVYWGGILVASPTFDTTTHTMANLGWIPLSYEVTATSSTTRLRFQSLDNSPSGPAIDNIAVTPEPSSVAVLAIVGMGLGRRRYRTCRGDFGSNSP